jgi:hypothetical protein
LTFIVAVAPSKKCWCMPCATADWCARVPPKGAGFALTQSHPSVLLAGRAPAGRLSSTQRNSRSEGCGVDW